MSDNDFGLTVDYDFIIRITQLHRDVRSGFAQLLDYCATKWPHALWEQLGDLDLESDVDSLRGWLKQVLHTEPPGQDIVAFYFGIFNPVLADGEVSCALYVSGSTRFTSDVSDWAALTNGSYLPVARYANSHVLHQIYSTVAGTEISSEGEYVLCLGYACLAVKAIWQYHSVPVAVGFDSGDVILLETKNSDSASSDWMQRKLEVE